MSLTTKMLENAGAGVVLSTDVGQFGNVVTPNFANGILYTQRIRDRSGLVQIAAQAGLTGDVQVQVRPMPGEAWLTILTVTQADWNADPNFTVAKVITMFPEMRLRSNITAGAPSVDAWITE